MTIKRILAKILHYVAGLLSRIKTYQRFYTLDSFDPPVFTLAGRHWSSCGLSTRLMGGAMRLDWDHWDHWACVHDQCNPSPCATCGGLKCADEGVNA